MKRTASPLVRHVLWTLLLSGSVLAQDVVTLERRAQSVGTLIESSSAARQIDTSGVAAARERRDNARLMHREARALIAAGDLAGAARLLDQAAREMMEAARGWRGPNRSPAKRPARLRHPPGERARAAGGAAAHHAGEVGPARSAGRPRGASRPSWRRRRHWPPPAATTRHGRCSTGPTSAPRVSIESMRRGDTLVRSLNFGSRREEYDYEIDRNDTHRMLITMLLADRKDAAGAMPPAMQPFIDKAGALRRDAEALARSGDHGGAVKVLEDTTRELVRAIRAGGIYIPG